MAEKEAIEEVQNKFRSEFLQVLRSRRTTQVSLTVQLANPVEDPLHQNSPPSINEHEIMDSCPKENIENLHYSLQEENLYLTVEAYASRGYIAISVDSRYHGECASSTTTYYDVWDLIKLADYLTQREDIDPSRIGITGVSLGGMHAWFATAADTRYAVVAPLIGVQGFRWAIDNEARHDLGKGAIDKEVVEKVWDRIAPGLASQFDSPYSIPSIAPRPLLILNGAKDYRCPLAGLEIPRSKASQAYGEFHCLDNFKFIAEPGIGHEITKFQVKELSDWFDKFPKP